MNIDFHVFIENLVSTIEAKDSYTAGHSARVAELSTMIAKEINNDKEFLDEIHYAGHLHDIGKIGIPDGILLKTARLTRTEYEVIKCHSVIGWEILKKNVSLGNIPLIIKHHHERFDGKGYPDKLIGKNIPLGARIIALADSFDAMVVHRTYKPAINFYSAIDEIKSQSGRQFDPEIVEAFLKLIKSNRNIEEIKHTFNIES